MKDDLKYACDFVNLLCPSLLTLNARVSCSVATSVRNHDQSSVGICASDAILPIIIGC